MSVTALRGLLRSRGLSTSGLKAELLLRAGQSFGTTRTSAGNSRAQTPPRRAPRSVYIRASDVAACIGRNKFKAASEVLADYWQRYSPATFVGTTTLDDQLQALERCSPAEKAAVVEAAAVPVTSAVDAQALIQQTERLVRASTTMSADEKEKVVALVTSTVQTGMGTRTEAVIAKKLEEEEGAVLAEDFELYSMPICSVGQTKFWVRGKIDRLQEEAGEVVLVEIKARQKRLFKTLVDYERVQIQTYLQLLPPMLGVQRARLVERYLDESHSIDVERDDGEWRGAILPGLVTFCNALEGAMNGSAGSPRT